MLTVCSEEYELDAKPIQAATSLDGPEATSLAKLSSEQYGNMVSFVRCAASSAVVGQIAHVRHS